MLTFDRYLLIGIDLYLSKHHISNHKNIASNGWEGRKVLKMNKVIYFVKGGICYLIYNISKAATSGVL